MDDEAAADVLLTVTSVSFISVAVYYVKNETLAWRLPLALSTIGPLALLIGIWFVPGKYMSSARGYVGQALMEM